MKAEGWMEGTGGERMVFRSQGDPVLVFYADPEQGSDPLFFRIEPTRARVAIFSDGRIWIEGTYYRMIGEEV